MGGAAAATRVAVAVLQLKVNACDSVLSYDGGLRSSTSMAEKKMFHTQTTNFTVEIPLERRRATKFDCRKMVDFTMHIPLERRETIKFNCRKTGRLYDVHPLRTARIIKSKWFEEHKAYSGFLNQFGLYDLSRSKGNCTIKSTTLQHVNFMLSLRSKRIYIITSTIFRQLNRLVSLRSKRIYIITSTISRQLNRLVSLRSKGICIIKLALFQGLNFVLCLRSKGGLEDSEVNHIIKSTCC